MITIAITGTMMMLIIIIKFICIASNLEGFFCTRNVYYNDVDTLNFTKGLDRNVRIWNPYMPGKPISILKAHEAPVIYIYVSDEEEKVFTISLDKCIFVSGVI